MHTPEGKCNKHVSNIGYHVRQRMRRAAAETDPQNHRGRAGHLCPFRRCRLHDRLVLRRKFAEWVCALDLAECHVWKDRQVHLMENETMISQVCKLPPRNLLCSATPISFVPHVVAVFCMCTVLMPQLHVDRWRRRITSKPSSLPLKAFHLFYDILINYILWRDERQE